jgi:hypothetical protein
MATLGYCTVGSNSPEALRLLHRLTKQRMKPFEAAQDRVR